MVPPPPISTFPNSAIWYLILFLSKILLTHATYSAFASDAPDFPLAPVYLFKLIPFPKNPALCLSETEAYIGSNPASTSDDNIFEKQNTLSNKFGLFTPNLFNISEIKKSNICDSIPVFPILPISSLSDKIHTAVFLTFSNSIIAWSEVYAQTLSSWP